VLACAVGWDGLVGSQLSELASTCAGGLAGWLAHVRCTALHCTRSVTPTDRQYTDSHTATCACVPGGEGERERGQEGGHPFCPMPSASQPASQQTIHPTLHWTYVRRSVGCASERVPQADREPCIIIQWVG